MADEKRSVLWGVALTGATLGIKIMIDEIQAKLEARKALRKKVAATAEGGLTGLLSNEYVVVPFFPNQQGLLVKVSTSYTKRNDFLAVMVAARWLHVGEGEEEDVVVAVSMMCNGNTPAEALGGLVERYEGGGDWRDDAYMAKTLAEQWDIPTMTLKRYLSLTQR